LIEIARSISFTVLMAVGMTFVIVGGALTSRLARY